MTEEGIERAFEELIVKIVQDQEVNNRRGDMIDDLWDESIKLQKKKFTGIRSDYDTNDLKNTAAFPTSKMTQDFK